MREAGFTFFLKGFEPRVAMLLIKIFHIPVHALFLGKR